MRGFTQLVPRISDAETKDARWTVQGLFEDALEVLDDK